MKRLLLTTLLAATLLLFPMTVSASQNLGQNGDGDNSVDSGDSGGGGGGEYVPPDGDGEGPPPGSGWGTGEEEPEEYNEIMMTPKVTALHSLNALFASSIDGKDLGVYFVPYLEDFPVPLKDTVASVVDYNNVRHDFAAVYDGYFDTEVAYVAATNTSGDTGAVGRLQTSKKVYSSVDNTRTLNLLGYDLLLSKEDVQISTASGQVSGQYLPTLVGTQPLDTQTVVMDLYKALGQAEWDIRFVWVEDEELSLDTSPIQQLMGVTVSDKLETGIDVSEGKTWVWATRTNPTLYWNKAKKDAIFDGGAHSVTNTKATAYVGSDVSVSFSKAQGDAVTFGEFCCIARAMMDLYGEPVMTKQEQLIMIQNYGMSLPDCTDTEVYDSVSYLAAKGIINPEEVSLNQNVTFGDIEPILVRIADKDSRLTFKETSYNPNSILFQKGYVATKTVNDTGLISTVDKVSSDVTTRYNDFFVECDDDMTNFILTFTGESDTLANSTQSATGTGGTNGNQQTGAQGTTASGTPPSLTDPSITDSETGDPLEVDEPEQILASDNIMCNGYTSASSDVWYSPDAPIDSVYPFEFKGVVNGFYHFRISCEETSVTISYERDLSQSGFELNRESYDLPNADGGVYLVENGGWVYYSFDEAENQTYTELVDDEYVVKELPSYSYAYIDNQRRSNGELTEMTDFGYMSTYNWIYMTINDFMFQNIGNYRYDGVSLQPLYTLAPGESTTIELNNADQTLGNSRMWVKHLLNEATMEHTLVFQTTCGVNEFIRHMTMWATASSITETNAYYSPTDNEVLVSVAYLRSKGLVSSVADLSNGNGKVLSIRNGGSTNVVLNEDAHTIVVGDTLYKVPNDTLLCYETAGELYINYRACIGWTNDYLILNNSNNIQLTVGDRSVSGFTRNTKSIISPFTASSGLSLQTYNLGDNMYLPMTACNPFGNYLLVVDETSNNDVLFMWKPKKFTYPGNGAIQQLDSDGSAFDMFQSLTGMPLSDMGNYSLRYVILSHGDIDGSSNDWTWRVDTRMDASGNVRKSVIGWMYKIPEHESWNAAASYYLHVTSAAALPVAKVGNTLYTLSVNQFASSPVASLMPYGSVPKKYIQQILGVAEHRTDIEGIDDVMRVREPSGIEQATADYGTLADCVIYPAPVGLWSQVKGLPTTGLSSLNSQSLLYGNQSVKVMSEQGRRNLVLGPNNLIISRDEEVMRALYLGQGTSGVYALNTEPLTVNTPADGGVEEILAGVEAVDITLSDPGKLIDWDAFKFRRLVSKLDQWSSIALIFALNVLPRIGLCLFMILLILSCIQNFRSWKKFCREHFDIYKFLTFGHASVDSISQGRLAFYSMLGLAVFFMICDGLLINFILWIARFFIEAIQR